MSVPDIQNKHVKEIVMQPKTDSTRRVASYIHVSLTVNILSASLNLYCFCSSFINTLLREFYTLYPSVEKKAQCHNYPIVNMPKITLYITTHLFLGNPDCHIMRERMRERDVEKKNRTVIKLFVSF